jgi:hypothetical protein
LFGSQAAKLRKKPWRNANCNKLLCIARGWSTDAARDEAPRQKLPEYR